MRTELHFHALPGVDDGPRDDDEALELAALALADGTRRVVATPHVSDVVVHELPERVSRLNARLAEARVPIEVLVGGELAPDDVGRLSQNELDLLAQGPTGRRWLLLEAPLYPQAISLRDAAADLRSRGFGVVIAHPERSSYVDSDQLRAEVQSGAWLQISAPSLTGENGEPVQARALALARSGAPFVVASDAHSGSRPPLLTQAAYGMAAAGLRTAAVDTLPGELLAHGVTRNGRLSARHEG